MAIDNPSNLMPDQEIIIEGDAGFVPKASPSDAGKVLGVLNSSGDVGWVVDQSGTFIQADWAETDSSQPSYIDHKPDLSVYATASSVETALSGKQDTISDLSEIRAGAAKGDTAVQPSALDDYATTSAMNTALAGKQDVINDLATIRSGASAGATAVQPSALESYATTSAMNTALAGKQDVINDLSDIRSGAAAGATAVQPSALESYATTSAMNTALAGKQDVINDLATIRAGAAAGATAAQPSDLPSSDELVPSSTSGDSGKVLTVDSNGDPSWQTPSSVTVDQTYNASSTNAQSGTAVAGAIAGVKQVPASTSSDANKVLTVDSNGAAGWQTPSTVTVDQTYNASSTNAQSGTAVAQAIAAIPSSSYTAGDGINISNNEISADFTEVQSALDFSSDFTFENPTQYTSTTTSDGRSVVVPTDAATKFTLPGTLDDWPYTTYIVNVKLQVGSGSTWTTLKSGNYYSLESIPTDFYTNVDIPAGMNGKYIRWFCTYSSDFGAETQSLYLNNFDTTANCFTVPGTGTLALTDPIPASAQADSGKVLKVNASGNAEWGPDGFTTTAGITDIQQVAALPAKPVATVLYLIPST